MNLGKPSKPWTWLEPSTLGGLLALGNTAMLSAWGAWLTALNPQPNYTVWRAAGSLGLIFGLGFGLSHFLAKRPVAQQRVVMLLIGLGVVALIPPWVYNLWQVTAYLQALAQWGQVISPVLFSLLITAYQWWQGLTLGQGRDPQRELQANFYFNLSAFAVLFSLNAGLPLLPATKLLMALLVSFGAGLSSLALLSAQQARQRHALTSSNRHWLALVLGLVGLFLALGLGLGVSLTPQVYATLQAQLAAAYEATALGLALLLALLALPIAYLLAPIVEWLSTFFQIPLPSITPPPTPPDNPEEAIALAQQSPVLEMLRGGGLMWLALIGVAIVLWFVARRWGRTQMMPSGDETRESVFSGLLLQQQLKQLFARPMPPATTRYLPLGAETDPRQTVRAAYQAMLTWAATTLEPRAPGQTPHAYAQRLSQHYPQAQASLQALTTLYLQARYAAETPTLAQAQAAQQASATLCALPPQKNA